MPEQIAGPGGAATAHQQSTEETDVGVRRSVRLLLERSSACTALAERQREGLIEDLVQIARRLVAPGGQRLRTLQMNPLVRALTDKGVRRGLAAEAPESLGVDQSVWDLISVVFHPIVESSNQHIQAYVALVAEVSASLCQFNDEDLAHNSGRDYLVQQFPDVFQLTLNTGNFGAFGHAGRAAPGPRVTVRSGVDPLVAIARISESLIMEAPIERLDDALAEAVLVPAACKQLAGSRQQLLATILMLGIYRVALTGRGRP